MGAGKLADIEFGFSDRSEELGVLVEYLVAASIAGFIVFLDGFCQPILVEPGLSGYFLDGVCREDTGNTFFDSLLQLDVKSINFYERFGIKDTHREVQPLFHVVFLRVFIEDTKGGFVFLYGEGVTPERGGLLDFFVHEALST